MAMDLTEADRGEKGWTARRVLLALALPICLALPGCMSSGSSPVSALSVDKITTAAITPLSADSEIMSDEIVIRERVGDLKEGQMSDPLPWSNVLTGSAGVISNFSTSTDGAKSCRVFETTRHGFDGVALFNGRACMRPDGGWDLVEFDRTGS